jgi:LacI family transcriptional regulator
VKSGMAAVRSLWHLEVTPDAIFAAGDYAALGAIQELKNRNVEIPEEVCIVGFSNEPFTKYMEMPITSISQTPRLMGKIAAQVILEQIKESYFIEKKITLPPELFIRDSSARSIVDLSV